MNLCNVHVRTEKIVRIKGTSKRRKFKLHKTRSMYLRIKLTKTLIVSRIEPFRKEVLWRSIVSRHFLLGSRRIEMCSVCKSRSPKTSQHLFFYLGAKERMQLFANAGIVTRHHKNKSFNCTETLVVSNESCYVYD